MSLSYFPISEALLFAVSGRDSERYLNARLTNEMRNLAPGTLQLAAGLNAQGRTQCFFAVLRQDDHFLLMCDGGESAAVRAALSQFIVADRVEVNELHDQWQALHLCGDRAAISAALAAQAALFDAQPSLPEVGQGQRSGESYLLSRQRTPQLGVDVLVPKAHLDELLANLSRVGQLLTPEERTALRIVGGLPEFPIELNERTLFSEAQLDAAVSFTKGCYVGQEVVEKVAARGMLPRVLRRMRVHQQIDAPANTDVVMQRDAALVIGKVLSSAPYDGATVCFVSIKNVELEGTLTVAGAPGELFEVHSSQ